MNILVIDDEREFNFPAVYARNLTDARRLLYSQHWDQVWLDNDLGESREEVRTLVNEMEQDIYFRRSHVDVNMFVVHTQNVVARKAILDTLWGTPFGIGIVPSLKHLLKERS